MSGGTAVSYEDVLAAGGVLPADTEGAGERAVPLTARTYRHPGLEDRVVVRLVAGELGAAEDLAAGFLGLEQDAEPAVVGLGLRQSLGFPEWVLVHHPADGHHALGVVPDLERAARQAKTKPKAAMDAYVELGERLAASVPHFLPTFYEQAGRVFLAEENATYAAQLFTRARKAEAEHGLVVEEERLDAVFLEFALAGALPVKVLSAYAKELAARVPAEEALRRFTKLCLRRTAGGLPPSAQMANDLRRLARAAGRDADVTEQDYLAELLVLPSTLRAAAGWWKGHRTALVALAAREPKVRGTLLDTLPSSSDDDLPAMWLDILQVSGATAALWDGSLPAEQRPHDGTAGWLERFLVFRERARSWRGSTRMPELYPLVERAADQLRAELASSARELTVTHDIDLMDLLLSLDVPVAAPGKGNALPLEQWAPGEGHRELLSLTADSRFHDAFRQGADRFSDDDSGRRAIRVLAASPGGRPLLARWVSEVVRRFTAVGLPQLPDALARLKWLPAEALALAEDEVRAAVATDLAPVLTRTLRAGLFDELGWPAWEDATATLVPKNDVEDIIVADAWPHLVVAGAAQARVIGAEGTLLTHDLRIPANDSWGDPGFHHVDGELLVYWRSRNNGLRGYWHTRADSPRTMEGPGGTRGTEMDWYKGDLRLTLPLPGGGRTTGAGVLHTGDTTVPEERWLIFDGASYWVWHAEGEQDTHGFYEYDPATNTRGRMSMPAFLSDALRDAPKGSAYDSGWLGPSPTVGRTPASAPVDGVVGIRTVRLPDGSWRTQDLAGHTVTLAAERGRPSALVVFPGDDQARAVVRNGWQLEIVDTDGVVTSVAKTDRTPGVFGEGTLLLPPVQFWECMTARDPEGSAALRRIDGATAAALLTAAAEEDKEALPAAIRSLLPVTHDALVAGVAGVVRHAAGQQAVLDGAAARLTRALDGGLEEAEGPAGPADTVLQQALSGVGGSAGYWWNRDDQADTVFRALRALTRAAGHAGTAVPRERTVRLHLDGTGLPTGRPELSTLIDRVGALAFRAAALTTTQEHREVLRTLLERLDTLGLGNDGASTRWREVTLRLGADQLRTPSGAWREGSWDGLLPLGGGAFLAILEHGSPDDDGCVFRGYFHDPAERFETPEPYTLQKSTPLGVAGDAPWIGEFLAELTARGPAPWFPEAAEEFARLTGVTETVARLVVAGLPGVDVHQRTFLTTEARNALGVKAAPAAVAKDELQGVDNAVRAAVVGALLPDDPAGLWTDGPNVAAAAELWNSEVGRRTAVPEDVLADALRAVKHARWNVREALPALLHPAGEPRLTQDLEWAVRGDRVRPVTDDAVGFTADTLVGSVGLAAWLAHRLPAGDPLRAALPGALTAVRERLAHPGLVLDLGQYISIQQFRKTAGTPTETGQGFERYGAVVLATHDDQPAPGIRVALLDEAGQDPYLPALRVDNQRPYAAEVALRLARSAPYAALMADPGDPVAGERAQDGTWWPQDPSRSVPELVTEVAKEYGIGEDAATLYLMLLAMPDPTDRTTARWTGWKPARLRAARAELAGGELVVEATRTRAGRSLFLPGAWVDPKAPRLPLERWKLPLFGELMTDDHATFGVIVPTEPAAELYRRAWQRVQDGDAPRFEELKVRRGRRR